MRHFKQNLLFMLLFLGLFLGSLHQLTDICGEDYEQLPKVLLFDEITKTLHKRSYCIFHESIILFNTQS